MKEGLQIYASIASSLGSPLTWKYEIFSLSPFLGVSYPVACLCEWKFNKWILKHRRVSIPIASPFADDYEEYLSRVELKVTCYTPKLDKQHNQSSHTCYGCVHADGDSDYCYRGLSNRTRQAKNEHEWVT